ncbi:MULTISPECIES: glycerophosphodiester phosphodiesterase family protein [unclassified Microbacterium]|uniref:glycerophosphodiester phosphodiesterase family protein n=1 Tax=unclassified Microbacterium TaxID=2609290 RepID=UPI003C2C3A47
MSVNRPLVIGHRGAPGYLPEHSRTSYDLALASGVDAVEPDVVFTADRIAVVRHENEIGSTTDVADHPEFASRRTTKVVDGADLTGWFTEDFTWDELATLRCRERLPHLRPGSAASDRGQPILRLRELLDLVAAAPAEAGVVLEVKHATYFGSIGYDVAGLLADELRSAGWDVGERPLVIESFEQRILQELRGRGIRARYIYLLEAEGSAWDLRAADGDDALTYADQLTPEGLDLLAGEVDGISLDKRIVLEHPSVVANAHRRGLEVYVWTCRPENAFLDPLFRGPGDDAAFGDWEGEWRRIAETGVDGVFVDHPDLGVAFFAHPGRSGDAR